MGHVGLILVVIGAFIGCALILALTFIGIFGFDYRVPKEFRNPEPPEPRHFNSRFKSCFDYGCTDDCPVALSEQLPRATIHKEGPR